MILHSDHVIPLTAEGSVPSLLRVEYFKWNMQLKPQRYVIQTHPLNIYGVQLHGPSPVAIGSTAVGIKTSEGVVMAVEKRVTSPLMVPSSIEKILEVDSHVGGQQH